MPAASLPTNQPPAQALFLASPFGLIVGGARGDGPLVITHANPAFCRMAGLEPGQAVGMQPNDLLEAPLPALSDDPERIHSFTTSLKHADGALRLRVRATFHALSGSPETSWALHLQPVDDARDAELEEMHRLFGAVFESVPIGMCITGPAGRILMSNAGFSTALGHAQQALFGRPIGDLLPSEMTKPGLHNGTCQRANGENFPAQVSATLLRDRQEGHCLFTLADQADTQALAARLREAERLESLGTLAGGVAHDFNNLLAIILGYAGLLRTVAPGNENVGEYADTIIQAGHRGADVVRQLMLYANQHEPILADTDLQTLLANTLIRATEGWPLTIRLECSYETRHPVVSLDSDQVGRAVEHLLRNAREAIKGSGTICLRMAERPAPAHARNQAGWMEIAVIDDGCGMDENTRARMFEPFFSSGKGPEFRGLGLAIVYGIVQAHRGRIEVDSAPGRGTRISILLPAKPGQHPHDTPGAYPKSKDKTAPVATLLLVEDEPDIARLWKDMLTRQGWTVHWAQDGAQALALHALHGKRIDLVFSDIGLPGDIDGWEVARRLRAERPGLPLVIASGFFKKGAAAQAALDGPVAYIDKPYQIPEVLQRLREFLPRTTTA